MYKAKPTLPFRFEIGTPISGVPCHLSLAGKVTDIFILDYEPIAISTNKVLIDIILFKIFKYRYYWKNIKREILSL